MTPVVPFPNREPRRCRYGYTSAEASQHLLDLLPQADRILPTQHAYQRMDEREVTFTQVLAVLRRGRLVHGPEIGEEGCWRFKYRADCGAQDVAVVVDLDKDHMGNIVAVVTVIDH